MNLGNLCPRVVQTGCLVGLSWERLTSSAGHPPTGGCFWKSPPWGGLRSSRVHQAGSSHSPRTLCGQMWSPQPLQSWACPPIPAVRPHLRSASVQEGRSHAELPRLRKQLAPERAHREVLPLCSKHSLTSPAVGWRVPARWGGSVPGTRAQELQRRNLTWAASRPPRSSRGRLTLVPQEAGMVGVPGGGRGEQACAKTGGTCPWRPRAGAGTEGTAHRRLSTLHQAIRGGIRSLVRRGRNHCSFPR